MSILRHPDFRRLWAADLLSQLGSRLSMSAIPLLAVLTLNASTLQVSLLRTCETGAWLVLGLFAGADTSYWIRQSIPFAGGGRVIGISGRNGILNSLRSSKEQGQSNFNNPGTVLLGAGADFDVTPQIRLSANANHLWFDTTTVLETLRNEGSIPKDIGWDLSTAAIWRPKATQNIVFRLSAAALVPDSGFRDLFTNSVQDRHYYSILANVILSY